MPRHTLDKWTYKLKTMNVCITQHKEEDIYNHMVKMYSRIQEIHQKFKAMYDDIMKSLDTDENNIYYYKNYNWRQGDPSRYLMKNADMWYLLDASDENRELLAEEVFMMYRIYADFMICDKYADWNDEKPGWNDMVYEVTQLNGFMKNSSDTIKLYENVSYIECKKEWQKVDVEWIQENYRKKEHTKHSKINLPSPTNLEETPEPYPEAPLRDDCTYCRMHWEEMKPKYALALRNWEKNKQDYDEWLKQMAMEAEKQKKPIEKKTEKEMVKPHCEDCDYQSKSQYDYDNHCETETHKEKLRYCKVCDLQCRSDYDYKNHISSQKHKKKAGLIDNTPPTYKCIHCDYESKIKCNYERHMNLKHNA